MEEKEFVAGSFEVELIISVTNLLKSEVRTELFPCCHNSLGCPGRRLTARAMTRPKDNLVSLKIMCSLNKVLYYLLNEFEWGGRLKLKTITIF
jgi:hypothetical protein